MQNIVTVPEDKIVDYIDGTFRKDTPEEYVRQTVEKRLIDEHGYFSSQIAIEYVLKLGSRRPRADIVIWDKNISDAIILPGRFKRIYVDEGHGVPFFGGRSIGELDPSDKKFLSFSQHDKKIRDELTIHEKMILITRSGTIGKLNLVQKHWEDWTVTDDIIRITPNKNLAGFIYIWLQTDYAKEILNSFAYGAVVRHIEIVHLEKFPVPILKNSVAQEKINLLALQANEKRFSAYELEQGALKIFEEEVLGISLEQLPNI